MVTLVDLDPQLDDARMEVGEDLQPLPLNDDERKTYIGSSLNLDDRRTISITQVDNVDLVENEVLMSPNLRRLLEDCVTVYGHEFWVV